jgi:hypothetical protein
MNKDKQIEEKAIEEMAKVIEKTEQIARDAHCGLPSPRMYAKDLYWHVYRKQSEWISVEERLPTGSNKGDMPENIIAYTSNGEVATGWLNVETWYLLYGDNDEHYRHGMGYVTHWMPLPEPPVMKGR